MCTTIKNSKIFSSKLIILKILSNICLNILIEKNKKI